MHIKQLCLFTSPCDFRKNVMSELLSHLLQSPSRAPPTVLLPNPQTTLRPCQCWDTTTRKHNEKVNVNRRNHIGRPVTLLSHSKDGRSDGTVTMRWITSNVMYSKDTSMSHRVYLMKISAGIYFYSYVVIPAQINHNTVYTITNDYV